MKKKQIIEKIMEEYSKYGLSRMMVKIAYIMAILFRVPRESIYQGMRALFNKLYNIQDEVTFDEAGKALAVGIVESIKSENNCTNTDVARVISFEQIDSLSVDFKLPDVAKVENIKITEKAKDYLRNFKSANQ